MIKDPDKRRENHRRYMKEVWYPKNKEKHMALVAERGRLVKRALAEYKMAGGCVDCGYNTHPEALDFDHVVGEKKFNLSKARDKSKEEVIEELNKCDVVCANCHRIRTFNRRQASR